MEKILKNTMCSACPKVGFVYLMAFDSNYYCLYCRDDNYRKGNR
jgi:hypothetical protein